MGMIYFLEMGPGSFQESKNYADADSPCGYMLDFMRLLFLAIVGGSLYGVWIMLEMVWPYPTTRAALLTFGAVTVYFWWVMFVGLHEVLQVLLYIYGLAEYIGDAILMAVFGAISRYAAGQVSYLTTSCLAILALLRTLYSLCKHLEAIDRKLSRSSEQ